MKCHCCVHIFSFSPSSTLILELFLRFPPYRWGSWDKEFSSVAQLCWTLWDLMGCSTPGLPVHHQLPEFTQTLVHRVSDAIQPSHPLLSPFPPAFNHSQHHRLQMSQFLASDGQSTGVSTSASVLPMNIQDWFTFRMDWLDLLAVQGTLKSLLQHHSSKASILRRSAFFTVQLSHPYMMYFHILCIFIFHIFTTGKTIALTRRTFVGKVISLLFNMLSRLVITFLPRSKRLLISWLQSPSAVILEPPPKKV